MVSNATFQAPNERDLLAEEVEKLRRVRDQLRRERDGARINRDQNYQAATKAEKECDKLKAELAQSEEWRINQRDTIRAFQCQEDERIARSAEATARATAAEAEVARLNEVKEQLCDHLNKAWDCEFEAKQRAGTAEEALAKLAEELEQAQADLAVARDHARMYKQERDIERRRFDTEFEWSRFVREQIPGTIERIQRMHDAKLSGDPDWRRAFSEAPAPTVPPLPVTVSAPSTETIGLSYDGSIPRVRSAPGPLEVTVPAHYPREVSIRINPALGS